MSRSCPCLDNNESFVLYQTDHKKNETKINVECTSHNIATIKHWKPTLYKCKKCDLIFSEYIDVDFEDSYSYVVDEVYEDYRYRAYSPAEHFWQAWEKVATPYYYISVTDRPIMEEFSIKISPPKYSGLPISIQKGNQSDVRALKGSSIRMVS